MATRFYLPSTGAAPISPAFSTWSITTGADILTCVTTRIASAMTDKATGNLGNLGANTTVLSRMYVSPPLAAQTISASTIKGTIRALESATNDNIDAMRLAVRIVSSDGSTFRSPVIYGPANSTVAELSTSLRAKRLATGGATGEVVVTAGDRVVIEIGFTNTGSGTSVNGSVNYGDDSATDLGDNETDTAANNPFVEIAADLVFQATGAAAITEAGDTLSATGTVPLDERIGSLTITEAGDTLSSAGQVTDAPTAYFSAAPFGGILFGGIRAIPLGDQPVIGTANITEGGDTLASAGVVAVAGASAITEAGDTLSSAGVVAVAGAAEITEAGDTTASAGTVAVTGAAAITEAGDTLVAVAGIYAVGDAAITEAGDTLASAGTVAVVGAAAITEAGDTLSSAGVVGVVGAAAITEAGDTLSATAGIISIGDAAITEAGDTLASAGVVGIVGGAAITEAGDTLSSAGAIAVAGAAAITEAGDTISAAGTTLMGFARQTFGGTVFGGLIINSQQAGALITEESDTVSSAGTVAVAGAATLTEAGDTLVAAGPLNERIGTLEKTEAGDTLGATGTVSSDETYVYIRDGGTGDGSAWNNALDDLPTTLTRGTVYLIADGSYGSYVFDDAESGTTLITIRKATVASHGTETGWDNAYGDGQATFGGMGFARGYYSIDGVTRNESDWQEVSSYGFRITDSVAGNTSWYTTIGSSVTIQYCDIGGAWSTTFSEGHPDSGIYIGGFTDSADDWVVRRCHIHNVDLPMHLNGITGWLIEYNHLGPGWSKETIRGQISNANTVIRYNHLHDGGQAVSGDPPDGRVACTAQIGLWDGNAGGFDNIEIYGNVISLSADNNTLHTNAAILVGDSSQTPPANNALIYNNTITGIDNGSANIVLSGSHTGCIVRNNLWYNNAASTSVSGADTASNNVVVSTNIFVAPTSSPPDMRLTSATDAGFSLSSPYNSDIDGNTRGGDGSWDVGAFEYVVVGDVIGTASITEGGDTLASAGVVTVAGAAAITEGGDTLSSAGAVSRTAAAEITEAGDTLSSAGAVAVAGAAAITEDDDTLVASAGIISFGSATITEGGDTVAGAGTVAVAGAAAITEAGDTVASAGTVAVAGAAAITEASDTVASAGTVAVAGAAAITEDDDTLVASAGIISIGDAAITEAGDTVASAGVVGVAGAAAITEAGDTLSGAALLQVLGILSVTTSDDGISAAGSVTVTGTLGSTEDDDTLEGRGGATFGAGDITEDDDGLSAAGLVAVLGAAAITEEDDVIASSAMGSGGGGGKKKKTQQLREQEEEEELLQVLEYAVEYLSSHE